MLSKVSAPIRWNKIYWKGSSNDFYEREFGKLSDGKVPIIYDERYNIEFWGLESLHPFDSKKYRSIRNMLVDEGAYESRQFVSPKPAQNQHLKLIHCDDYLASLEKSAKLASIAEFPPLAMLPSFIVKNRFTVPCLYQVGGTILAGFLALENKWAISIGGGMHHAWSKGGGGWCVFSDIVLSYQHLRLAFPELVQRILIVDLDVHQGNGHERDKLLMGDGRSTVVTLDAFRPDIYPSDCEARGAIDIRVELSKDDTDEIYLDKVKNGLEKAESMKNDGNGKFDIVYYVAGTDILNCDPLGGMRISPEAVCKRDQMVWEMCSRESIPIVHVLAGGYTKPLSAKTVAKSILNLKEKGLLETKVKGNL